ncbi:hypothetical protein GUITHDRAFT_162562 [Guillardia theta CCMP2712]|uniref:Uncharacterized protein n=2 Tax=Guillardia theta TaxID=55529 RepID=L1JI30_GUITC|nr:hypothetical protein GUITHDRAFT_162562 [Guillardia theta CCMP2712]EKX47750.1 hypothetical protein GUITHDRAFT_162562 [Guillardia theta CCMP2712]|mmetsp:Transcript_47751/g.149674  ORF Transcript_47751/g.149674 Transcript_47751/m.149674 type:complete len:381 (+) Transcript_47751:337-1479(+)|eukprot:XP_005834730.1 hypothetical protein GUITHDRAFT_162562 [Guillardia theta CCMP2712]
MDWNEGKPPVSPAWDAANNHFIEMEKRKPRRLQPKDPVPPRTIGRVVAGQVKCFNQTLLDEVTRRTHEEEVREENEKSQLRASRASLKNKTREDRAQALMEWSRAQRELQLQEENKRRLMFTQRRAMKQKIKNEEKFQENYHTLKEEAETFLADLDEYLHNKHIASQQKRKALYTEWKECVFNKIQDQLLDKIDTMGEEEIAARRRDLFQKYIDAASAKDGGLFLDIVIENEYNPFAWKKHTLRYRAKPAKLSNGPGFTDRFGNPVPDPIKRDLEKMQAEAKAARSVGGDVVLELEEEKIGREILPLDRWSKIEATPFFDRAAKVQEAIASGLPIPPRKGTKSSIDLNDFQFPTSGHAVTREMQTIYGRGKRCNKPQDHS